MVVIAHDDGTAKVADDLQTFAGTGIVADDVAGTEEIRHALAATVVQNDLERVEVRVDVTENRKFLVHYSVLKQLAPYFNSAATRCRSSGTVTLMFGR